MDSGLEATLERQARTLRTIGIPLVVLGGVCACVAIYCAFVGNASTAWSLALGVVMFGGLGVVAYRRSKLIEYQRVELRRTGSLPPPPLHDRTVA